MFATARTVKCVFYQSLWGSLNAVVFWVTSFLIIFLSNLVCIYVLNVANVLGVKLYANWMLAVEVNIILSLSVMKVSRGKNRKYAIIMSNLKKLISSCRVLVGRPEGKRPLGRPKLRWEDNIKMDLQEVEWWDMDWIDLAQDRERWQALVSVVMNLWIP